VRTTWPTATPTTEETTVAATPTAASPIAYQTGNLGVSVGIPIYDTPAPNETPTVERTLPSPLANTSNVTEEPTEEWTLDVTPTAAPTLFAKTTATGSAINNSSAAAAPGGSIFGDAWMILLAAVAGVALVSIGVVTVRRSRDDDL